MTAASIRSWVQKAIRQTLAFLAGKDLRNNRIGVQHNAVEGVWRIEPKPPARTKRVLLSWLTITGTPVFFVSVASKGFNKSVSLLFATLVRRCISVAAKGLS